MNTDQYLGKNVQRLRGDVSQEALASQMRERGYKWSQATVWAVEKGERPLKATEVLELCLLLDCTTEDLMTLGQSEADRRAREMLDRLEAMRDELGVVIRRADGLRGEARCLMIEWDGSISPDLDLRLQRRMESFTDLFVRGEDED